MLEVDIASARYPHLLGPLWKDTVKLFVTHKESKFLSQIYMSKVNIVAVLSTKFIVLAVQIHIF